MKKVKGPNHQARTLSEVRRLTKHFCYWRKHFDRDKSEVQTHTHLLGFNPLKINIGMVEYELHRLSLNYQCITITYCEDNWGKRYKLFGLSQTNEPLRLLDTDVTPIITAAKYYAEEKANTKHIRGRAMVLTPYVKNKTQLLSFVWKLKSQLDLRADDLAELEKAMSEEPIFYDVERKENLTVEERIKEFFAAETN